VVYKASERLPYVGVGLEFYNKIPHNDEVWPNALALKYGNLAGYGNFLRLLTSSYFVKSTQIIICVTLYINYEKKWTIRISLSWSILDWLY
jgi:hypothetical protein